MAESSRRLVLRDREVSELRSIIAQREDTIEDLIAKLRALETRTRVVHDDELVQRLKDEIDKLRAKYSKDVTNLEEHLRAKDRVELNNQQFLLIQSN